MKDYTASRSLSTDKIGHGKARTQDQTYLQPLPENSAKAYQPTGVVGIQEMAGRLLEVVA